MSARPPCRPLSREEVRSLDVLAADEFGLPTLVLMENAGRGAADRLGERMAAIDWRQPSIPVVQNAEERSYAGVEEIRGALQRQLYLPVRWTECVQALAAGGAARIAECGPGKVLAGLIKRIDKSVEARPLGDPAQMDAALAEWA